MLKRQRNGLYYTAESSDKLKEVSDIDVMQSQRRPQDIAEFKAELDNHKHALDLTQDKNLSVRLHEYRKFYDDVAKQKNDSYVDDFQNAIRSVNKEKNKYILTPNTGNQSDMMSAFLASHSTDTSQNFLNAKGAN